MYLQFKALLNATKFANLYMRTVHERHLMRE